MLINYHIKKQLYEFNTPQEKIDFLQNIIKFCGKVQQNIHSNAQFPHVEVVDVEIPVEKNINNGQ